MRAMLCGFSNSTTLLYLILFNKSSKKDFTLYFFFSIMFSIFPINMFKELASFIRSEMKKQKKTLTLFSSYMGYSSGTHKQQPVINAHRVLKRVENGTIKMEELMKIEKFLKISLFEFTAFPEKTAEYIGK